MNLRADLRRAYMVSATTAIMWLTWTLVKMWTALPIEPGVQYELQQSEPFQMAPLH